MVSQKYKEIAMNLKVSGVRGGGGNHWSEKPISRMSNRKKPVVKLMKSKRKTMICLGFREKKKQLFINPILLCKIPNYWLVYKQKIIVSLY